MDKRYVMGLFPDEEKAVGALDALKETAFELVRIHSPIPSHALEKAMKARPSKVGLFTLTGGIIGFFTGFLLASYTAVQWNLIVSGKPVVALVPFFIVGFEFTILFAVFGNVIGLLSCTRLPRFSGLEMYDERCSGEHFGILAACPDGEQEGLMSLVMRQGGEARLFPAGAVDPG